MPYSALVPYAVAGKRAMNFYSMGATARNAKRARYVAAHVIKYGPRAYRAAKVIRRVYRRYKKRGNKTTRKARREFGHPVGTSSAKKTNQVLSTSFLNMNTRTLYSIPLTRISFGDSTQQRERNIVNFRGCKICMEFNHADTVAQPLYLHVAVLSNPKQEINFSGGAGWSSVVSMDDFFRGSGSGSRTLNFDLATNFEMHCNPINTDSINVHWHKKYRLDVNAGGYDKIPFRGYMNFDKYLKINKQIRFDGTTIQSEDQIHLVMWCSQFHDFSLTPSASTAITANTKIMAYFREPKVCC